MQIIRYHNAPEVHQAVMALKNGEVIVLPTDTVYGLCGNGFKKEVYEKIYQIKKRSADKAFPLFVKDLKMAGDIAFVGKRQMEFLRNVWPGKTSVVLKIKDQTIASIYKGETIALRMPRHHIISEIFEFVNFPIIGTSANISGMPDALDPQIVFEQFNAEQWRPDYILDYGILPKSQSSTIIDITSDNAKILREGAAPGDKLITIWLSCVNM